MRIQGGNTEVNILHLVHPSLLKLEEDQANKEGVDQEVSQEVDLNLNQVEFKRI